jgi:hypothetical protein
MSLNWISIHCASHKDFTKICRNTSDWTVFSLPNLWQIKTFHCFSVHCFCSNYFIHGIFIWKQCKCTFCLCTFCLCLHVLFMPYSSYYITSLRLEQALSNHAAVFPQICWISRWPAQGILIQFTDFLSKTMSVHRLLYISSICFDTSINDVHLVCQCGVFNIRFQHNFNLMILLCDVFGLLFVFILDHLD